MHLLHAQIKDYHIKKIATFLAQIHSIKAISECMPPNVYKKESHFVNCMYRVIDQEPSLRCILSLDVIETLNQIKMMWLHYNMLCISGKWVINKDERSISIEKLHVWTHVVMSIHKKTTLFLEPIYYQNILKSLRPINPAKY